jgi:ribulose-phosphate 3-epimerase
VDGGVAHDTVAAIVQAGAELLVAGNAVFGAGQPERDARALLDAARQAEILQSASTAVDRKSKIH